ncbi:MAG: hypothetical protein LBL35_04245 [Clostridiales bacterium]|jgi:hypothetical protein|nr:hypothetical protein [Clostridiales bacterium]
MTGKKKLGLFIASAAIILAIALALLFGTSKEKVYARGVFINVFGHICKTIEKG